MPLDKRNRPVLSCTNCRNKKRKCDRHSPCSSCVRFQLEKSCKYSSAALSARGIAKASNAVRKPANKEDVTPNLANELLTLKDRLEKIEASITLPSLYNVVTPTNSYIPEFKLLTTPEKFNDKYAKVGSDDFIDLYCNFGTKSRAIACSKSPISLFSFQKRDPISRGFRKIKKRELFIKFLTLTVLVTQGSGGRAGSGIEFQAQSQFGVSYIPRLDQKVDSAEIKNAITLFSPGGIKFTNIDLLASLVRNIIAVLPDIELFWQLFNYFFSTLYPFFPVLDEFEMREDLTRIFKFSGNSVESINVESKNDLSVIVSILFLMRISYVSIVIDRKDKTLHDFIAVESVNVAETCLKELEIYKQNDLSTLQAFILQAIYRKYSPEKGNFSSGSEVLLKTGFLIQMAMSMGLNRDPSLFVDLQIDERLKNLRRKIWHFLISMDDEDSLIYNIPNHVNPISYDTEIPQFSTNLSNIKNEELEKGVIRGIRKIAGVFKKLKKIKDLTLVLNSSIKVDVLLPCISKVERMLSNDFDSVEKLLKDAESSFISAKKIKLYVLCKMFIMLLNHCLFLFYERKENDEAKCFFLKKLLFITFHDLSRIFDT